MQPTRLRILVVVIEATGYVRKLDLLTALSAQPGRLQGLRPRTCPKMPSNA